MRRSTWTAAAAGFLQVALGSPARYTLANVAETDLLMRAVPAGLDTGRCPIALPGGTGAPFASGEDGIQSPGDAGIPFVGDHGQERPGVYPAPRRECRPGGGGGSLRPGRAVLGKRH